MESESVWEEWFRKALMHSLGDLATEIKRSRGRGEPEGEWSLSASQLGIVVSRTRLAGQGMILAGTEGHNGDYESVTASK